MSDAKLRELERRWRETGAVGDEAAYLLERVRVGDLKRERLVLAAYCGHRAARRAVADAPPVPSDVRSWVAGVDRSVRGVADLAVGRLAQLLAKESGKATMGPRTSTLRQVVRWAEAEGATLGDILTAVSRVALNGVNGLRVHGTRSEST